MATLFDRKDSPYWWAKVWNIKARGWRAVRTDYRKDDPTGKRKALMYANALDRTARADRPLVKAESWYVWVPGFLARNYAYNAKTLQRYETAWSHVSLFLTERDVSIPRRIAYHHAADYMKWRTAQKRHCGKPVNPNTAITEIKVLSRIMREAHQLGYCESNPLYHLGLKRTNVKEKPELRREEIEKIFTELEKRPEWMQVSFKIALCQGCRLSETQVELSDITESVITFHGKGRNGEKHIFTTALNPELIPLIRSLKSRGLKYTCVLPSMAAKEWHFFFKEIGLPHVSFHSTRVTVITRMARGGVTQQKAMRFVGHASATVHRIYQRLQASDVADVAQMLSGSTHGRP